MSFFKLISFCLSVVSLFCLSRPTNVEDNNYKTISYSLSNQDGEVIFKIDASEPNTHHFVIQFCLKHQISLVECRKMMTAITGAQRFGAIHFIEQMRKYTAIFPSTNNDQGFMPVGNQHFQTETIQDMKRFEHKAIEQIMTFIKPQVQMKRVCFIHSTTVENQLLDVFHTLFDQIIQHGLIHELQHVFVLNYGPELPLQLQAQYTSQFGHIHFIQMTSDIGWFEVPTLCVLHQISSHLVDIGHRDLQVLYLHTKGVTYILPHQSVYDWTNLMLYFLVERHKTCKHLLKSGQYDTIGVNFMSYDPTVTNQFSSPHNNLTMSKLFVGERPYHTYPPHFGGNFWWVTGDYLRSIPALEYTEVETQTLFHKYSSEMWLLNPHLVNSCIESGLIHKEYCYAYNQKFEKHLNAPVPRVFCPHNTNSFDHYNNRYERVKYVRKY